MYKLIIDTANEYFYIACIEDKNIIFEIYEKGSSSCSEALFPRLKEELDSKNISLKDVSEIYCGVGPGSYTGVRIGVTIAKVLSYLNGAKLYSFSSLAGMASSVKKASIPMIDARRGRAYVSSFDYVSGKLTALEEDGIYPFSEYMIGMDESLVIKEGKINPLVLLESNCINLVSDPTMLLPNYLQLVEAERDHKYSKLEITKVDADSPIYKEIKEQSKSQSYDGERVDHYVLKSDDKVLSFVDVQTLLPESEILYVYTNNDSRREGYARYLLTKVIDVLKEEGNNRIFLEVNENNKNAIALYKQLLFREYSRREKYYGEDSCINMKKECIC